MSFTLKVIDPDLANLTNIGHFLFLGNESEKKFRAQIINEANNQPYFIPAGSSATVTFPDSVTVTLNIEANRSVVNVILDDAQLSVIKSGDLTVTITEPSETKIAFLGSSVKRILPLEATDSEAGLGSVTGKAKTTEADETAGYLSDEIQAGAGITKTIIDDPTYGKVIQLSSDTISQTFNNNSGATIAAYRAVKLVGDSEMEYADNTSLANAKVAGITTASSNNGEQAPVATDGTITTSPAGFLSGDTVYLGSANGQFTNSPPSTPGTVIFKIGRYNDGKVYINFEQVGVN